MKGQLDGQGKDWLILSLDFGTSALKLSVLTQDLYTLQSEKVEYSYHLLPGEKVEEKPDDLWRALESACARIPDTMRKRVRLLCYDTYSPSLVLMDGDGNALYPIVTHMDRRSRRQSGHICKVLGAEKYQSIAGVYPFTGGTSLTSLLWFMQEEPLLMHHVQRIGHLQTYLHKRLTGIWAIDMVNASMMGLYDTVRQSGWSREILDAFSIPERWLSPIFSPGLPLGGLVETYAARLGLPAGIPVAVGTNDVVAAHAGAGNDRAGQILNTAGSSDMVSILTDSPVLHPNYYVRNAGKPGLWQIYATTSGGFSVDWFRKQFCKEMGTDEFFKDYLPYCAARFHDNVVTFAPYLAEDRQSMERRTAHWEGLTLSATRDQMLASLLLSMQNVLWNTVQLAENRVPLQKVIKITGGFAQRAIIELKEKVFEGYRFEAKQDCTILGNARLAMDAMDQQKTLAV